MYRHGRNDDLLFVASIAVFRSRKAPKGRPKRVDVSRRLLLFMLLLWEAISSWSGAH
jgi:hypothetical protein